MMFMDEEKRWQEEWERGGIFHSEPDKRKKFLITVPWPYTSGPLHVGHGRTYTLADIIARYKRMTGYNVLFPMGFHESGTPIGSISEKIKRNDEKTLNMYRKYISEYENIDRVEEILESFKDPLTVANYFASKIVNDFKALGYSIDWRRTFRSIDPLYSKFVEWQFRKLGKLGHLTQGSHPVLFSSEDGNAVGEDDIEDGDTDKVSIEKFTMVLFKVSEGDYNLAACSLRPETLFAITNLWINPEATYLLMNVENTKIIVSEQASKKILNQFAGSKVLCNINNDEITQKQFQVPLTNRTVKVYENSDIDPEQASGVVYSVPGHSVMDLHYMNRLALNIDPLFIIETNGSESKASTYISQFPSIKEANAAIYRKEFYEGILKSDVPLIGGRKVKEAREIMNEKLAQAKSGLTFYETSRKARTRDGKPVIVSIMHDQWFIDYSELIWKERTRKYVEKMSFHPEFYRKNMFDIIDWIEERACARKRGLGTPLPQDRAWVIESLSDSTIYPAFYTFSHLIKDIPDSEITDSFFDYITGNETDVLPWKKGQIENAKREFEYWYGVDQRITSASHMSNHLVFYLMNHAALFNESYQPKGISIVGMVISNGSKISKSKGNAISLLDVVNQYGADLFRLYVALVAEMDSLLDWNETEITNIKGVYESLHSLLDGGLAPVNKGDGRYSDLFKIKFKKHTLNFLHKMDELQVRNAYVEIVYEVIKDLNELSNIGLDKYAAVNEIIEDWIKILSCVLPHMCENYWSKLGKSGFVSKTQLDRIELTENDILKINYYEYLNSLLTDIRAIKNITRINPSTIRITICSGEMKKEIKMVTEGDMNVSMKNIIGIVRKNRGKMDFDIDEFEALSLYGQIIKTTLNAELNVEIYKGDGKGKIPMPGRPLIELEGERIG